MTAQAAPPPASTHLLALAEAGSERREAVLEGGRCFLRPTLPLTPFSLLSMLRHAFLCCIWHAWAAACLGPLYLCRQGGFCSSEHRIRLTPEVSQKIPNKFRARDICQRLCKCRRFLGAGSVDANITCHNLCCSQPMHQSVHKLVIVQPRYK